MLLSIDPADPLPIYVQIVRQLKFAIAHGAIRPGEQIPSVRELARTLAINPNTVARAYRELQNAGLVSSQRGLALIVAPDAGQRCQPERAELIRARLRQVLKEARQSGLSQRDLAQLMAQELARLKRRKAAR